MSMFAGPTWGGKNRMGFWLTFTAVLEIGLAAVFFFIGSQNRILKSGFYLTAAILAGVGILLLLWARKASRNFQRGQRLRTQGIKGTAAIQGMEQTGVVLNEINPQIKLDLLVTLSDGRPAYPVSIKEFVPGMMIGRLTNGQPLPVAADPMNPQNIVVLWEEALSSGGAGVTQVAGVNVGGTPDMSNPMEAMGQQGLDALRAAGVAVPQMTSGQFDQVIEAQRAQMRAHGIDGTAVVKKAQDTGQTVSDERIFQVELEVTPSDGRPPFTSSGPASVPETVAGRVRKGLQVPVKINPQNPDMVMVEWTQAL